MISNAQHRSATLRRLAASAVLLLAAATPWTPLHGQEQPQVSETIVVIRYNADTVHLEHDLIRSLLRSKRRQVLAEVLDDKDAALSHPLHNTTVNATSEYTQHPPGVFACRIFLSYNLEGNAETEPKVTTADLVKPTLKQLRTSLHERLVDRAHDRLRRERDTILAALEARRNTMNASQDALLKIPKQSAEESQQEIRLREEANQLSLDLRTEESALEWCQRELAESSAFSRETEQRASDFTSKMSEMQTTTADLESRLATLKESHSDYRTTAESLKKTRTKLELAKVSVMQLRKELEHATVRSRDLAQEAEVAAQRTQRIRARLQAVHDSIAVSEARRDAAESRRTERSQIDDQAVVMHLEIEALRKRVAEVTVAISQIKPVEIEIW